MYTYNIYQSPLYTFEAVKQGWSWPAFFFAQYWALMKNLWVVAIAIFFIQGLLVNTYINLFLADPDLSQEQLIMELQPALLCIITFIGIILGFFGNKLRQQNLQRRGYKHVGVTIAESPQKAIANHMEGNSNTDTLTL